jgi:hypothetical protein
MNGECQKPGAGCCLQGDQPDYWLRVLALSVWGNANAQLTTQNRYVGKMILSCYEPEIDISSF